MQPTPSATSLLCTICYDKPFVPKCKPSCPSDTSRHLCQNCVVPYAGLERKEAKLIFVWSQLIVTDELRRRKRAVGLLFLDFVEVRLPHRRWQSATALVQQGAVAIIVPSA